MTDAYILDIDETITDDIIAKLIGLQAIEEMKGIKKSYGIFKGIQTLITTKTLGQAKGLESFGKALKKAGITKQQATNFCEKKIEKHFKPGALEFLRNISENNDLYLVTTGPETGPEVIHEKYNIKLCGYLSNKFETNEDEIIISCKAKFNDKNIGKSIEELISEKEYNKIIIIDDRPERYENIDNSKIEVYNSIDSFKSGNRQY